MKRKWMSVGLIIALLLPLLVGGQPVSANSPLPPRGQQAAVGPEEVQKAIEILDPYVTQREDGTFDLSIENPQALGIRPEVYQGLLRSMEKTNGLVRESRLTIDEQPNVYLVGVGSDNSSPNNTTSCELSEGRASGVHITDSCPGSNYVKIHWWGLEIGLDHCATQDLIYALEMGAGAAAIVAIIAGVIPLDGPLGEVIAGVVAAVLGMEAATYSHADGKYGCGSITNYSYVFSSWVSPQKC